MTALNYCHKKLSHFCRYLYIYLFFRSPFQIMLSVVFPAPPVPMFRIGFVSINLIPVIHDLKIYFWVLQKHTIAHKSDWILRKSKIIECFKNIKIIINISPVKINRSYLYLFMCYAFSGEQKEICFVKLLIYMKIVENNVFWNL